MKTIFVHIPKTGGRSVREALVGAVNTMHLTLSEIINNHIIDADTFVFSVVRNPYTRAYSYYQYFKETKKTEITFLELLNYIKSKPAPGTLIGKNPTIADRSVGIFTKDQTHFLLDSDGKINLNKIYRFENISEIETDFNIILPKVGPGNYTLADYKADYDRVIVRQLVKEIFSRDFTNFGYSVNFDKSLE